MRLNLPSLKYKILASLPLLLPIIYPTPIQAETFSAVPSNSVGAFLTIEKESFPDMTGNYEKTVAEPARIEKARLEAIEAARIAAIPKPTYRTAYTYQSATGTLTGSMGYAIRGNCVNEIPYNLRGQGNPSNWSVTTQTPYIGGAGLFYSNHVVRITGFWSNGDLEVAHQGWNGAPQTRFPRSTFRGFK